MNSMHFPFERLLTHCKRRNNTSKNCILRLPDTREVCVRWADYICLIIAYGHSDFRNTLKDYLNQSVVTALVQSQTLCDPSQLSSSHIELVEPLVSQTPECIPSALINSSHSESFASSSPTQSHSSHQLHLEESVFCSQSTSLLSQHSNLQSTPSQQVRHKIF